MIEKTEISNWQIIQVKAQKSVDSNALKVAIEIQETRTFEGSELWSAEIMVRAYPLDVLARDPRSIGSMGGSYNKGLTCQKITGGSMMLAERYRGLGIGTYMMQRVVSWARETMPLSERICQIHLSGTDAKCERTRDRRNYFYRQFGIRFPNLNVVNGIADAAGYSDAELTISDIHPLDLDEIMERFKPTAMLSAYSECLQRLSLADDKIQMKERALDRQIEKVKSLSLGLKAAVGTVLVLCLVLAAVLSRR